MDMTWPETGDATAARMPVRVERLSCRLGDRLALDGIDLSLSERRIGIVGRNGSGKTTLARAIAGLIEPGTGRVLIGGADMARDRKAALSHVGILFQNPDHQIIFPTVGEELAFGLTQMGQGRAEARDGARAMLARFGREDWEQRAVSTLSQGQRHLVCLMAVLAMRPAVIVLDEPFAGLDLPTLRVLRRHLEAVEAMVIQVSHDTAALSGYDRVIWLESGRVAADGPAGPVLARYLRAMEEGPDAGADL